MFDLKTRFIIVDDFPSMREMMKNSLMELGFQSIVQAENGEIAWNAIKNTNPPFDIILSDWNMPKLTGLDLLKKVRQDRRLSATPFILVTTENEKTQILEALKAGVNHYIVKPFSADLIRERLQAIWDKMHP